MNITKNLRDEIIKKADEFKKKFNDEELNTFLNTVVSELNRKKYGLTWEKHAEDVLEKIKDFIPVFLEEKNMKISSQDGKYNFVLEGDNLHSLHLLNKTHYKSIDIIYIDPPYNTGNNDFIYNDKYVNQEDGYIHSKWLSFMNERLIKAKKLLSEQGVIFISIDDNEQAQLKLLCDQIFGESNFIANSVRKSKAGAGHDSNFLAVEYDYTLVYAQNIDNLHFNKKKIDTTNEKKYKHVDKHVDRRGKYYLRDLAYKGSSGRASSWPVITEDNQKIYSNSYGRDGYEWRWGQEKYNWGLENDFIVHKKVKGQWRIYIKQYQYVDNNDNMRDRKIPHRAFMEYLNNAGTSEVREILGNNVFSYPKPKDFIKHILYLHPNKDATILDFFAGSGTTGHAVLEQNANDNGNRTFILCTNNQNDIARNVTYERIKKVIKGYKNSKGKIVEGIEANLKYFYTKFVSKENKTSFDLTDRLEPYVKELVELENHIDIDSNHIYIRDEDDADMLINETIKVSQLYVSSNVLLNQKQKKIIKSKGIKIIDVPEYYFLGDY